MTLVLEIEHLLGVAFAAQGPASSLPDWPPQPDRVFSALVAAWGARGQRPEERRALEWLEEQAPPEIAHSGGRARTAATVFVPPNDPQSGRVGDRSVLPALRRRQARRFPAFRPQDPLVRLVWREAEAEADTLAALNALAADTPYLGHSASLARFRFRGDGVPEDTSATRRRVYRGRLTELEQLYHAGRRPGPGELVRDVPRAVPELPGSVFADRWLVLEHLAGPMPDLRAAALVAKRLRHTLMSGYARTLGEAAVPPVVSGHAPDGSPLAEPHLAIVPLAFLGPPFADGRVLGFALVPPGDDALLEDPTFQQAVKAVAPWNESEGLRALEVVGNGFKLRLSLSGECSRRSLDPEPYVAAARVWATCTPIVLDRHLKTRGNAERDREMREQIARACSNVGLPPPARIVIRDSSGEREEPAVAVGKHSAFQGAPPAYPSGRAPAWTRWRLPDSLASRQLTHAVLQFEEPVRGPVLLGAGRFHGLGLCRAHEPKDG